MLHLYELRCSLWLNPVFPLCHQVYKATGEEFLKIAGGQISFFFLFLSSLSVCMKTCSERFSVRVRQTFISRLPRIFEEKQDPSTSVRKQLFTDHKRRALICALALSLLLPVFLPHPSDSLAAYLGLMKDALWGTSPTSLPHHLTPPITALQRPVGEKIHSPLTAAHLFSTASSSTPLRERRLMVAERTGSVLVQRGCEETKAGPGASGP